ncbi:MAG: hypothetical protein SGI77_10595 [Pirellulaceae bacterium]|nr:hypothetical protein [Pirellulaceae bacterium]
MVSQNIDLLQRNDDNESWNRLLGHLRESVGHSNDLLDQLEAEGTIDFIELGVLLNRIHKGLEQTLQEARLIISRKP